MRPPRPHRKLPLQRPALLAVTAAVALAVPAASAWADAGHDGKRAAEHGMTADEHAGMSAGEHGMTADDHAQMDGARPAPAAQATPSAEEHGMTADEHATHGGTERTLPPADAHDAHGAPADAEAGAGGHDDGGHDSAAAPKDRPAALVLGGFGVVNAIVLLYAAVIRRRPDALKRRQTLQRVRNTPPKQTVFPPSSPSEERS